MRRRFAVLGLVALGCASAIGADLAKSAGTYPGANPGWAVSEFEVAAGKKISVTSQAVALTSHFYLLRRLLTAADPTPYKEFIPDHRAGEAFTVPAVSAGYSYLVGGYYYGVNGGIGAGPMGIASTSWSADGSTLTVKLSGGPTQSVVVLKIQ